MQVCVCVYKCVSHRTRSAHAHSLFLNRRSSSSSNSSSSSSKRGSSSDSLNRPTEKEPKETYSER